MTTNSYNGLCMVLTFLKDTFRFYWQHLSYFAAILIPIVLPMEIAGMLLQVFWVTDPQSLTQQLPAMMLQITLYPIYQGALVLGVSQLLAGNTPRASDLWNQSRGFWYGILAVNAIYFASVFLGTLLFILPGIYVAVRLVLAEQNIILNRENPIDAVKSSWQDTSDQFGNLFLGSLMIGGLVLLLTTPMTLLLSAGDSVNYAMMIIPALFQFLLYPLFVIYYIRVRHYIRNNE